MEDKEKFAIDKTSLQNLLKEVSEEFKELFKSDEPKEVLAKAEDKKPFPPSPDSAPADDSEGSAGPTDSMADAQAQASDAHDAQASDVDDAAAAPTDSTPDTSESQAAAQAAPEGNPQHEAGEIEPAPTVEELQAEYAALDLEALKMHYRAAKGALMQMMGMVQAAAAPDPAMAAPAPMAPAPAAPAAPMAAAPMGAPAPMPMDAMPPAAPMPPMGQPAPQDPMAMGKSETDQEEQKLLKSEVETLKAKLKEQEEVLSKAIEYITKPLRKSIKGISEVSAKDAPIMLTKEQINKKLRTKARDEKLEKSDRDLITQYSLGKVDLDKVSHLLK